MVTSKTLSLVSGFHMVKIRSKSTIAEMLVTFLWISLFTLGCINMTEHATGYQAGLHVVSAYDFSLLNYMPDIPGARSLLLYPGNVFVVSTEGKIIRYDSETLELVDEYQIAPASAAGFSEIVFSVKTNSAYLIGAFGKILEISLPDCTVIDEFSVCQSPVKLAIASGSRNLLVADGATSKVFQVITSNNTVYGSIELFFNVQSMAPLARDLFQSTDSILIPTSGELNMIQVLGSGNIQRTVLYTQSPNGHFLDFAPVPYDTFFVAVYNSTVSNTFTVGSYRITVPYVPPPEPPAYNFFGGENLFGTIPFLEMGYDYQHAYLLTYCGNNTSRLTAYNYRSLKITREEDFPGYPVDMKVSGDGIVYILTAEY